MEPVLKLMQIEDDFDKNLTVFMNKEESLYAKIRELVC